MVNAPVPLWQSAKGDPVFSSVQEVSEGLAMAGYLTDDVTAGVIYLASRLHKPLLLEGPAGSRNRDDPMMVYGVLAEHREQFDPNFLP